MNKSELVEAIAKKSDMSKAETQRVLDTTMSVIEAALKKGDDVRLVGFGTFSVSKRKATEGRNPRTGEKIKIAARKQPRFSAGKQLKAALNGKKK